MKFRSIFAVACLALAIVAMPVEAQTRKEKKAAQKEAWEREQRQKAEEDELRHKLKMDSIANAQKVAAEKAAKEEVILDEPCSEMEYPSTEELMRGHGIGVDRNQQFSIEKARGYAINDLASQISSKVESLLRLQNQSKTQNENVNYAGMAKQEIEIAVQQTTGFTVACRKTVTYSQSNVRMLKTYMVIEISAERLLKAAYDALQKNNETKIEDSFEDFHRDFKAHFQEL